MYNNFIGNMYGPYFLALYAGVVLGAILFTWWQYKLRFKTSNGAPAGIPFSHYEIAYARNGKWEAAKLAVYSLLRKNYLTSSVNDQKTKIHLRKSDNSPPVYELHDVEKVIYDHFKLPVYKLYDFMEDPVLLQKVEAACSVYKDTMEKQRMIHTEQEITEWRRFKTAIIILMLLPGVYKLMAAAAHGRSNIGFLLAMMIASTIGMIVFFKAPRLTVKGKEYIDRMKDMFSPKLGSNVAKLDYDQQFMMAGLFGLGAMTMLPHSYIDSYLGRTEPGTEWFAQSSGSCGSGGCSSGGGCGGGCGGCGGCS